MKNKLNIIITSISLVLLTSCQLGGFKSPNEIEHAANDLKTPTNLTYNEKTRCFKWNPVEHADSYEVRIGGETFTTPVNSYYYLPSDFTVYVGIKALSQTNSSYYHSNVKIFTYDFDKSVISESTVSIFLRKLTEDNIVSVNGLYISDGYLYAVTNVYVAPSSKYTNVSEKVTTEFVKIYKIGFNEPIETLSQVLSLDVTKVTYRQAKYEAAEYDSAYYFINSSEYVGQMEEYRQMGYNFEIVSSIVKYDGYGEYTIYGTYRLEKNGSIKYIYSTLDCTILNSGMSEKASYTTALQNIESRNVQESDFYVLEGDLQRWANNIYTNRNS